ncbi:hypothetical protein YC2023_049763 [Brassica napus]
MEHRNGTNDSRGNGKKLANTIGTPSCIAVHNEENVMEVHDEDQIIDALQDMDIVGSSSFMTSDHTTRMECDVDGDDLLGDELIERESGGASLERMDSAKGHKHKRHGSSRSGARAGVRIGARPGETLSQKAVVMRRASPMKRKASSSAHILASLSTDVKGTTSIDSPSSPRQLPLARQTDYSLVKHA